MKGTVEWKEEMEFTGKIDGIAVEMGKETRVSPMQMMLLSVAGCTSFDVIYTLKKFREPVEGLKVEIEGERRDEHPKYFTTIRLYYKIKGNLNERKVKRAIMLSQDTYCSALAQMKKSGVEVEWDYKIITQ